MLERVFGSLAQRYAWLRTALDVQARFSEIHGGYLTSAITLAAFLSLFPLLLVAVAVVGFVSISGRDVTTAVTQQLSLGGEAYMAISSVVATAEKSRRTASIVGVIGLLWSGLGVVAALQYAWDEVWQATGRGFRDKPKGLLWLVGAGIILVLSIGATWLVDLAPAFVPLTVLLGITLNTVLFAWTHLIFTRADAGWKQLLPGAVLGGVGLEVLKFVGRFYVPRAVAASSGLYGSIGIVFATIAWLFFFGRLAVYSAVLNVVRWEEKHGTVTAEIELPRQPGVVPLGTTRAGDAIVS